MRQNSNNKDIESLSPTERTFITTQLCLRSRIRLWTNISMYHLIYRTTFLQIWVLQILLFGLWEVWCVDGVRSANCARTMDIESE